MSDERRKELKKQIQRNKLVTPVTWNSRTGHVVGGNHRIMVIDELQGSQDYHIDVAVVDVDDIQERALNVALNNMSLQGEWDYDKLEAIATDIFESGVSFEEATGFEADTVQLMFSDNYVNSIFRDQAEADDPLIDELEQIYEETEEDRQEYRDIRAARKREARAKKKAEREAEEGEELAPEDIEYEADDEEYGDVDYEDVEYEEEEHVPRSQETKEQEIARVKRERKEHVENRRSVIDAGDVALTVTFIDPDQITRLLDFLGENPSTRYISYQSIFRELGLDE